MLVAAATAPALGFGWVASPRPAAPKNLRVKSNILKNPVSDIRPRIMDTYPGKVWSIYSDHSADAFRTRYLQDMGKFIDEARKDRRLSWS